MKRLIVLLLGFISLINLSAQIMVLHLKDGSTCEYNSNILKYVDFKKDSSTINPTEDVNDYIVSSDVKLDNQQCARFSVTVDVPSNISMYAVGVLWSQNSVPNLEGSTMLSKNITSSSTLKTYTFEQSDLEIATTYYYRPFVYVVKDGLYHLGAIKSFTTYGSITVGDAIDLGLPSGNLWSSTNIGASSAIGMGDLYAWGETETKDSYTTDNYKYYFNGSYFSIGNYISQTEYDIANIKLRGKWHMPTRKEFLELKSYCNSILTSLYGVNGYIFIGQNGNSIFMPSSVGYWTSESCDDYSSYSFLSTANSTERYEGLYIRPVYGEIDTIAAVQNIIIDGTTVTLTNSVVKEGSLTETIVINDYMNTNASIATSISTDNVTISFDAGTYTSYPKYYTATNGVRVYPNNTITFTSKRYKIAKIVMECDSYNGIDYVGNSEATLTISGNTIIYTNASEAYGIQLRVKSIKIIYEQEFIR